MPGFFKKSFVNFVSHIDFIFLCVRIKIGEIIEFQNQIFDFQSPSLKKIFFKILLRDKSYFQGQEC